MSQSHSGTPRGRLSQVGTDRSTPRSSSLRRRVSGMPGADQVTPTTKQAIESSPGGLTPELRDLARVAHQSFAQKPPAITPTRRINAGSNPPSQLRRSAPRSASRREATTPGAKLAYQTVRNTPMRNRKSAQRRRSRGFAHLDGDLMDVFRDLSRLEVHKTRPYVPTPPLQQLKKGGDGSAKSSRRRNVRLERDGSVSSDSDSDRANQPPRMSLGSARALSDFGYDSDGEKIDDDDDDIPPSPSYSLPNLSPVRSPERARRAISERPPDIRESLGIRLSDRFNFLEENEESMVQYQDESQFEIEDDGRRLTIGEDSILPGADIGDQSMMERSMMDQSMMDQSIIPLDDQSLPQIAPPENDETTDFGRGETTGELPLPLDEADNDTTNILLPPEDEIDDDGQEEEEPEEPQPHQAAARKRTRKQLPESQYGIPFPSLPTGTIKKLATGLSRTKISADALKAIISATEAYFEQAGEDLGAMARHAGRKTIEELDVVQVLRRQRQINDKATVFSLASKHLPHELLQHIRIQVEPKNVRKQRRNSAA